ncbi:hypothetical protein K9M79_08380 [Candidatus Woesearchaeota archaeon]|nr:hypothetical protein [Candidatus Woesearchaeota archaeon]
MLEIKNWVIEYIKHRDLLENSLKEIKEIAPGELLVRKSDSNIQCLIDDNLDNIVNLLENTDHKLMIVVPNKISNLKALRKNWETLSKHRQLKILFVNPDSGTDKRWIIIPYIHNRISDPKTLSQGLKTLFESVEVIN